jgi:hypothetical protein
MGRALRCNPLPLPQGQVTHSRRQELERNERYLTEQIVSIYVKLLPHEKPRLNSIDLKGDPQNPLQMQVDLTGLSDGDLHALARILPKLGGATDQGEAGGGPGGELARRAPTEGPKTIRRPPPRAFRAGKRTSKARRRAAAIETGRGRPSGRHPHMQTPPRQSLWRVAAPLDRLKKARR